MAKRFTATEKWDDPWFHTLDNHYKLVWLYLLDKCDHAGIWKVNRPLIQFHIGIDPDINVFNGRVIELNPEKWLIQKFVEFQYGVLNPGNRAHASVIHLLQKEGASKGLTRSLQGPKDKDKEQDKDKDKEVWFEKIWEEYPQKGRIGKKAALRHFVSSVKSLEDAKRCAGALDRYLDSKRVKEGYVQNGSTWFNDWQSWENYTEAKDGTVNS